VFFQTVIVLVDDHKMLLFCFGNSINYIFYLFISLYKLIINYYIIFQNLTCLERLTQDLDNPEGQVLKRTKLKLQLAQSNPSDMSSQSRI